MCISEPRMLKKLLVVSCGEENCSRNCNIGFRDIGLNAAETWLMPPVFCHHRMYVTEIFYSLLSGYLQEFS